jgi:hypothetical protein
MNGRVKAIIFLLATGVVASACERRAGNSPPEPSQPPKVAATRGIVPGDFLEYVLMDRSVMERLINLPDPSLLPTILPPSDEPYPAGPGLMLEVTRPNHPRLSVLAVSQSPEGSILIDGGICKYRDVGEATPSYGACLLIVPKSLGWPRVQNFMNALREGYDPMPLASPDRGMPAGYSWGEPGKIFFSVQGIPGRTGLGPVYGVVCEERDEKCLRVWEVWAESFWMPLKYRYEFLPDLGDPIWGNVGAFGPTTSGSEFEAYFAGIPEILRDPKRPSGNFISGPSPYWTEEDERALSKQIAREKSERGMG